MMDKSSDGAFDWNVTGASICYLGVEVQSYLKSTFETIVQLWLTTNLRFYWINMVLMSSGLFFSKYSVFKCFFILSCFCILIYMSPNRS